MTATFERIAQTPAGEVLVGATFAEYAFPVVDVPKRRGEMVLFLHFLLMIAAWGTLIPWGIAVANKAKGDADGRWFRMHVAFNTAGWTLQLAGLAAAVVYAEMYTAHFRTLHSYFGIIGVALGTLQPLNGVLRPGKPVGDQPKTVARSRWEIGHKVGGMAALLAALFALMLGVILTRDRQYDDVTLGVAYAAIALGAGPVFVYLFLQESSAAKAWTRCCLRLAGKEPEAAAPGAVEAERDA